MVSKRGRFKGRKRIIFADLTQTFTGSAASELSFLYLFIPSIAKAQKRHCLKSGRRKTWKQFVDKKHKEGTPIQSNKSRWNILVRWVAVMIAQIAGLYQNHFIEVRTKVASVINRNFKVENQRNESMCSITASLNLVTSSHSCGAGRPALRLILERNNWKMPQFFYGE